ncbi:MAG: glycerophosphodiester phosphodiesterase family protein [Myxococcota bacterium]
MQILPPLRLYGHRGAPAELPENTLPSFLRAIERGVDALELDVHLSRDGHIIVAHDPDGRRMAGSPRDIRASRLDELLRWDLGYGYLDVTGARPHIGKGIRLLLLDELLDEVTQLPLNIDIKARDRRLVELIVKLLRERQRTPQVLLTSFDSDVLTWVRDAGYTGQIGCGRREIARLLTVPERLLQRAPRVSLGDAVQVPLRYGPFRFDNHRFIDKCHRLGLRVDFWTINDEDVADRLLAMGADGLMSDDPRRLVSVVAAWRTRR